MVKEGRGKLLQTWCIHTVLVEFGVGGQRVLPTEGRLCVCMCLRLCQVMSVCVCARVCGACKTHSNFVCVAQPHW
jgi:hypothetical protein